VKLSGLFGWLLICFCAAAIGAFASIQAESFYAELVQPDWAPPASVFGPVWSVLYAMMAVAAWLVWRESEHQFLRIALTVFLLQLVLNTLWSWLFFRWQLGALAFIDIVFLWVLIFITVLLFWRVRPLAAVLLIPYLLWVTFASALNYSVWQLNPQILS